MPIVECQTFLNFYFSFHRAQEPTCSTALIIAFPVCAAAGVPAYLADAELQLAAHWRQQDPTISSSWLPSLDNMGFAANPSVGCAKHKSPPRAQPLASLREGFAHTVLRLDVAVCTSRWDQVLFVHGHQYLPCSVPKPEPHWHQLHEQPAVHNSATLKAYWVLHTLLCVAVAAGQGSCSEPVYETCLSTGPCLLLSCGAGWWGRWVLQGPPARGAQGAAARVV